MSHRAVLQNIAHRAMVRYGLLPEFSPAALDEARSAEPAEPRDRSIRDAREYRRLPEALLTTDLSPLYGRPPDARLPA